MKVKNKKEKGNGEISKAILIIDMPECCGECKMSGTDVCRKWNMKDLSTFPKDCPIMEVPEKDNKCYFPDEYQEGYSNGWNACIRKILRED